MSITRQANRNLNVYRIHTIFMKTAVQSLDNKSAIEDMAALHNVSRLCIRPRPAVLLYNVAASSTAPGKDLQMTSNAPFSKAKIGPFFQVMPQLGNQFLEDVTLVKYLKRHLPTEFYSEISTDLERFGHRVTTDIYEYHLECDKNLPYLEHYNAWGKRVDRLVTCNGWKRLKKIAAEEGLIAIGYERKYSEYSRLYQMSKQYLFDPSGGLVPCPLAMTDGAAKTIETLGLKQDMKDVFDRLTSRDGDKAWTSGQWMTERKGGSDVASGTETVGLRQSDGSYRLYGYKWFSSATDSDMALTLARPADDFSSAKAGTKGLSLFYLPVRHENGELNGIEVQRLKNKLGTKQVPTAELLLDGAYAQKISDDGRGVAAISSMLTITRIRNAVSSAAAMRRVTNLARDYSTKRVCFNKLIKDHPLHVKTLADMEVEARGATLFVLEMSRLLGLDDCNKMSDIDKDVFRLMTPILKLYTAKQAMSVTSEGLECFGGMGYLEDTGLPLILRDAQVLPIWEGTTNILSLDVLRALGKSQGSVLKSFVQDLTQRLEPVKKNLKLKSSAEAVLSGVKSTVDFLQNNPMHIETAARHFAFSLARNYMGLLLLEQANWAQATSDDITASVRWCQKDLCPVVTELKNGNLGESQVAAETDLVFQGHPRHKL